MEQQVDHDHAGRHGQVDANGLAAHRSMCRRSRYSVTPAEAKSAAAAMPARGSCGWQSGRRGRVGRYRETRANTHSGGAAQAHDEQVHGTYYSGEALGRAYELSSSTDRHDVTMT